MIERMLRQLKDDRGLMSTVDAAARELTGFGFTIGSVAPGDATTYQFACVSAHPFIGNGVVWASPGQRIWWFGTETNMARITMIDGQYLHGLDGIVNEHSRVVASLFVSLVESEIPGSMGMGDAIEVVGLWQEELQRRRAEA